MDKNMTPKNLTYDPCDCQSCMTVYLKMVPVKYYIALLQDSLFTYAGSFLVQPSFFLN